MHQTLVGSILLSAALTSQAITLGLHSGAAVIGRPLDVRVQALLGPEDDTSALCVTSEVLYGDVMVPSSSVNTSVQRTTPDAQASIRVQVSRAVNEPVVTVVVKAGCSAPFSRRFVLLADPASELVSGSFGHARGDRVPVVILPPLAAESQLAVTGAGVRKGVRSPTSPAPGDSPAAAPSKPKREKVVSAQRSRPASVVRKPAPAPAETTPRLQLDPVDLSLEIERDPTLKLSLALLSEPTASEDSRAAAALLWKAINAKPEDILRDTQKLAMLEAESKGLRDKEAENKATLKVMQSELASARYTNWLAYLFGALLLLTLAGLWWLIRGRKEEKQAADPGGWWTGTEKPIKPVVVSGPSVPPGRKEAIGIDIDLNLDEEESSFDGYKSLHKPSASQLEWTDSLPNRTAREASLGSAGARSTATEELFDVQQQADFFVSLGEHKQAINVLKDHLAESQEPSPLAYLDLFRLYHQLGQHEDYERLRETFNHLFNAGAPPFEQYSVQNKPLEDYETAFGRIQALWPQPRVLDLIEKSIFKEPNDPDGEVFGLEAYRELLLLHSVAKEMITRELDQANEHVDFQNTAIKPLKAAGQRSSPGSAASLASGMMDDRLTQPMEDMPRASPRLALDVDLDALAEMSAFEASLPDVPVKIEPTAKRVPPRDSIQEEGNLIDFEVLDFTPPDDEPEAPKSDGTT